MTTAVAEKRGSRWKGGRAELNGYAAIWMPDHPNAQKSGYVYEHVLVVSRALGRPLRGTEQVHHVNEDKKDNSPGNLVLCPDMLYHRLLHTRGDALAATGDVNARKCTVCKRYDSMANLIERGKRHAMGHRYIHRACETASDRARRQAKRVA